jgi:O-antigen/teichoic acid export membrane protein
VVKTFLHTLHERCGDLWWYTVLLFIAQRFGDAINMFVGMWLVPKYVAQNELGALMPLMSFVGFIGLPLALITTPFLKFITVFVDRGELGKAKSFVRDVFVGVLIFSGLSLLLASLVLPFMFERLRIENGSLGLLMVAVCLLGAVSTLFGNMMQGFKMYSLSVWTFALSAPFRLLLILLLMPFRPLSGYLAGQAAGPVVNILGAFTVFRRHLGASVIYEPYWREYASAIIRYTLPFILWTVVTTVTGTIDSLVIRHRLSEFESAGYYIITRFTDIAAYLGTAFGAFVFPMVASKQPSDKDSIKILMHSIVGSMLVGFCYSLVLGIFGADILGLTDVWRPYSDLSGLMALWSVNTTLWSVGICLITYETAQGRFRFLWYAIPIVVVKASFLYAVTGYTFFEGIFPKCVMSAISELNPCRLSFLAGVFIVAQLALTTGLLLDVFCFNGSSRRKQN